MLKSVNEWIAVQVTKGVANMWCAYAFGGLAVYGFPYSHVTPQSVVQWVSQEFLQLVLLSVIMVGQKVQQDIGNRLHEKVDGLHEKVDQQSHV